MSAAFYSHLKRDERIAAEVENIRRTRFPPPERLARGTDEAKRTVSSRSPAALVGRW